MLTQTIIYILLSFDFRLLILLNLNCANALLKSNVRNVTVLQVSKCVL